jgi:putative Ca2+/H+ antiporter (TMEM165/GDT1 family)
VNATTILTVFVVVAVAELPDKTMIATVIMGSRGRPLWVWIGASCAFVVHVALAVTAGALLSRLPHTAVEIVVTVLFLAGALYLLFVPEQEEERGEGEAADEEPRRGRAIALSAFGVILVGEFGDLTQILTANFVAKTHEPASVAVGALTALVMVSAIGAFGGRALLRVLPLVVIRRGGGVILLGFAAYSIYSLATG